MTFRILSVGGIGDGLLLTPVFRELKRRWPGAVTKVFCVNKGHLEIFTGNPHIDVLRPAQFRSAPLEHMLFKRKPSLFSNTLYGEFMPSLMRKHATTVLAEMLDVDLLDRRLEVFLTREENASAAALTGRYPNPVAIHVTSTCSANQHWPKAKWETLVAENRQYTFLQLGGGREAKISGAVDLRGTTTLREAIAILKHVRSFVGVVSFLAHATNAVGTRGVVLFGPSAPAVWGHPNNVNLTRDLPCSPCVDVLLGDPCPYGAPCMADISVEEVSAALELQVASSERDQAAVSVSSG
jgi:ADP-heptose:LPS heptosyltransferase